MFLLCKKNRPLRVLSARTKIKQAEQGSTCVLCGGDKGIRTPDLRIANATLYQLSHIPTNFAAVTACDFRLLGYYITLCDFGNEILAIFLISSHFLRLLTLF